MHEQPRRETSNLAAEIFELMSTRNASEREGTQAICFALVVSMITSGLSKERALDIIDRTWALIEPSLNEFNAKVKH